jgi:membrane protein DedA with SNARE-associated domain
MGQTIRQDLEYFLGHYGYWAVFVGILAESAGIPMPGETILIVATVAAATHHSLNVFYIGAVAVVAAITGDNLGFGLGKYGGYGLLRKFHSALHISESGIERAEALLNKHGSVTVFIARFIAGLRILVGPLAGVLGMQWSRFLVFNALGAIAWVSTVVTLATFLGASFESAFRKAGWLIAAAIVLIALHRWRTSRLEPARRQKTDPT